MTTTAEPPTRLDDDVTMTVESGSVATLRQMLDDPRWSDREADIRRAITYLTATSMLGA